jgi:ribosomal protein L32
VPAIVAGRLQAAKPFPCCTCRDCVEFYSDGGAVRLLWMSGDEAKVLAWRVGALALVVGLALLAYGGAGAVSAWRRRRRTPGYCRVCGYDLAGLPGRVCPECGSEIGEEVARRAWVTPIDRAAMLGFARGSGVSLAFLGVALLGLVVATAAPSGPAVGVLLIVWPQIGSIAACALTTRRVHRTSVDLRRAYLMGWVWSLAVMLAVGAGLSAEVAR